ncbi:hypothetical protein BCR33DRAFT_58443 [Rhizoclosmatium globosum]|uniref:Uncharacterized protein n=1 Tax=Rhizoclosmatium globosum TaxID=329046 RepID=A0A1Y2CM36_9FUNG|nr:hypothetical protein BCR33DRAFT_58443 [Rhizoclosmatium globosum]|eukprot:ORY48091.1 hypothetical protein BCR33DRAFT_58443 [Rhizoclosmatium globosum]
MDEFPCRLVPTLHKSHVTPVLHWSQTLTRRAFTSWRTYIQTRRSKASLMTSAETWRQETTMRDACVMWMIGADKLRRVREGWRAEERVRDVERR